MLVAPRADKAPKEFGSASGSRRGRGYLHERLTMSFVIEETQKERRPTSSRRAGVPEVCDTTTGTCGPCTASTQCPGDAPICNPATKKCGPAPAPPGPAPKNPDDEFSIQGAGCACSTTPDQQSPTPALLGIGLALTVLARRRKTDARR